MTKPKKEKPLPKPPATPFGGRKAFAREEDQEPLTADRMAAAMAEGKLDEFLQQEMPDNEYARNLATMMMGMTGMMPVADAPAGTPEGASPEQTSATGTVPEDVRRAVLSGDAQGLVDMLRREHRKRSPGAAEELPEAAAAEPVKTQDIPAIDKELIDALVQVAQDNSVSLDWIILRAIKVYIQEYRKTGKL
jgi:hypothetical protein